MDELGKFLKSRRARLHPADTALGSYGGRRRVPGLRREELAQLAGVSASYYARLEQGLGQNVSDAVLDSLARALRLDDAERAHLLALARPNRAAASCAARVARQLPDGLQRLMAMMGDVPVMVLSPTSDVLAWNPLARAVFGAHHEDREGDEGREVRAGHEGLPNMTRMIFLDPPTRALFADWEGKARSVVAHLRMVAARFPADGRVRALVGELLSSGTEFAALWEDHSVANCDSFTNVLRHPQVGELTLFQEVLRTEQPELMVVAFTVEPGSPSETALRLLGALTADRADHRVAVS
ncbi:helix-turn-helix transcriptional regulator [Kitasatospora sp. NPDC088783]|uniref:helix-turn-helix transcriptional regulator n=1 Tax=Kitasatospora sp. NPDC088783 TaxID=3364077 RepID=UPI00383005CD